MIRFSNKGYLEVGHEIPTAALFAGINVQDHQSTVSKLSDFLKTECGAITAILRSVTHNPYLFVLNKGK